MMVPIRCRCKIVGADLVPAPKVRCQSIYLSASAVPVQKGRCLCGAGSKNLVPISAGPGSSVPVGIGGLKLVPARYTMCFIGAFGQMSVPIGIEKAGKSKELLYEASLK